MQAAARRQKSKDRQKRLSSSLSRVTGSLKRRASSPRWLRVGHVRHVRAGGGCATASWWPAQPAQSLSVDPLISICSRIVQSAAQEQQDERERDQQRLQAPHGSELGSKAGSWHQYCGEEALPWPADGSDDLARAPKVVRGKTAPALACSPPTSSRMPENVFSFVKRSLHQFCIEIGRDSITFRYTDYTDQHGGPPL